jgi:hypothetical protein
LAASQACAAGKYLAATGSTVCTDCVAGTFSAVVGATVASTCATCVAGKYAAASASTVCTDCPAGKISAAGATACSDCEAGKFSSDVGYSAPLGPSCAPASAGWKLVRRTQRGRAWHTATDNCFGSEAYGIPTTDSTADTTFSVSFEETVPGYDELLFATGDCQVWLITTKNAIGGPFNGEYYGRQKRQILKSSINANPYTAEWLNRRERPEDPWISVIDHDSAISAGMLVYGENIWRANLGGTQVLVDHNGANVFIRKHFKTEN